MHDQTNRRNLEGHANYNAADLAYLRDKGYSDDEIIAIWDRDARRGQGPQTHANAPRDRKTTMLLMLRAFQTAVCHIPEGERRNRYEAMLKSQGIDDIDALVGDFIELMDATR